MAERVLDEEWERVRDISKHVLHMIAQSTPEDAERWARVLTVLGAYRLTLRGAPGEVAAEAEQVATGDVPEAMPSLPPLPSWRASGGR